MQICRILVVIGVVGCNATAMPGLGSGPEVPELGAVGVDPDEASGAGVPDVRCDGPPDAGSARSFAHFTSKLIADLGDPRHRGFDLVTAAGSATQRLEGWISYTIVDKALEDEDVELFACRAGDWQRLGAARTDDEGHFSLALTGPTRLPIGMRDLFVSVVGDRTGVRFLGYVAPAGAPLAVSDVDGTLTSSENAFLETIALGIEPAARPGAAATYGDAAAHGRQLVYVTARGNQYTTATRDWLDHHGLPRGPVRLSPSFVTLPGSDTVDFKTSTIAALTAAGLGLSSGIGNRASDVAAYARVGLPAGQIFVELPEFASELEPLIDGGQAIGFTSFGELSGKL